jgi:hypothetical protein
MKLPIETLLRWDLTAIVASYNVPRGIAVPILQQAIIEMKRQLEARGDVMRRTDKL